MAGLEYFDWSGKKLDSPDVGMLDSLGNYIGKQSLGDITGTVGLGLGTYNDLFGTGSKVAKERLSGLKKSNELLGLNIDATKQSMADRKQFNAEAAANMNAAMIKGLGKVGLYDNTKVV